MRDLHQLGYLRTKCFIMATLLLMTYISNLCYPIATDACLFVCFVSEGISTAYETTSAMIMFCHVLMLLEIAHAAVGIVKSSVVLTVLQVRVMSGIH